MFVKEESYLFQKEEEKEKPIRILLVSDVIHLALKCLKPIPKLVLDMIHKHKIGHEDI